ncbi:hypothetical protein EJ06DRAFT_69283 [Trichodelitschia bisporula]|uniref:Uncharacterized protein n=1 Tax=Trichodelitschia bisporula TaxID=703511 RepID=A0A6G1HTA7_9PEZI|nr:hypothetical protein EJ06DRAFT_69283 [Trichodelitschia bisporula]
MHLEAGWITGFCAYRPLQHRTLMALTAFVSLSCNHTLPYGAMRQTVLTMESPWVCRLSLRKSVDRHPLPLIRQLPQRASTQPAVISSACAMRIRNSKKSKAARQALGIQLYRPHALKNIDRTANTASQPTSDETGSHDSSPHLYSIMTSHPTGFPGACPTTSTLRAPGESELGCRTHHHFGPYYSARSQVSDLGDGNCSTAARGTSQFLAKANNLQTCGAAIAGISWFALVPPTFYPKDLADGPGEVTFARIFRSSPDRSHRLVLAPRLYTLQLIIIASKEGSLLN